jgi:hypothetical protein
MIALFLCIYEYLIIDTERPEQWAKQIPTTLPFPTFRTHPAKSGHAATL